MSDKLEAKNHFQRQPFTKYFRETLVSMSNSALWEGFNIYFSTAVDISDRKLKKALSKLKIWHQVISKIEGQKLNKESDDDNKAKAFDFVIESQKSEVKVGKKGCNKKG